VSAFIVALPATILLGEWLEATTGAPGAVVRQLIERTELALALLAAAGLMGALSWALHRQLPLSDALRLLLGATTPDHGWGAPSVARLLSPVRGPVTAPNRDSPAEHGRAILEIGQQLHDLRVLTPQSRVDASAAARRLLDAIQRCDTEIARLSCDASTAELDRLAAQIDVLEADPIASPERRQLLQLLRRQLELLRHMRVQCEIVSQRRAQLFSLLRGLWQQLSTMRDAAASGGDGLAAHERVRDLLEEIAREMRDTSAV
jgi:hypothetical protein